MPAAPVRKSVKPSSADGAVLTAKQLSALEKQNIERAPAMTGGKVAGADGGAALLGRKTTTLYSKIKVLGIERSRA